MRPSEGARQPSAGSRAWPTSRLCSAAGALLACLALSPPAQAHEAIERQIADLNARIAAHPQEAALYLMRGELHREHADWNAAARDYQRARDIDPGLDAVDLGFGRLRLDTGRPAPAIGLARLAVPTGHAGPRARGRSR
ncbi:MAG TPA: hypothetical protein VGV60_08635 [Candidatus Polarisedimenticolia bacterium]|jgi:predicted Zn-dependent protease|nr:hypothetical protein [Candidatus Polarisedimenticolia bacterium]